MESTTAELLLPKRCPDCQTPLQYTEARATVQDDLLTVTVDARAHVCGDQPGYAGRSFGRTVRRGTG